MLVFCAKTHILYFDGMVIILISVINPLYLALSTLKVAFTFVVKIELRTLIVA